MSRFKISALVLFALSLFAAPPRTQAQTSQIPLQCKDTSGSSTAQSCTTVLTMGPVSGDSIIYTTTTGNTGDVTLNVDSKGAAHIRKWSGSSVLASGDLVANVPVQLIFDGTYWELQTIGNAPNGSLPSGTQGNPFVNTNGATTYATSPQSIDVTSYGVTSSGDQTANFQAAANAIPSTGGVLKVPAGLTILLSAPITFPHTPVTVDCSGGPDYGAATTFFETATATYLFRVGTINNGSAQQQGVLFKACGFADSSASHNTALGAIYVTDTNNSGAVDSSFFNFNRPAIATPSAPSISAGSGSTSYWVQISCATDMGGHTIYSPEATAVSGTTTLTVTAPTSSGCPAPSSGYLVLASTTATGTETLQAASGCTLNSSGTACSLTSNWVGTVTAGNLPEAFFQYDTSAGAPIIVDGQSGANGTPQDASYGHWDNNTFQNSQECMIFDGGIQGSVDNNHLSQCVVYGILTNRQNAQIYSYGNSFEIPNNTTARGLILNGTSPSHVEAKFEGTGSGNTNITCSEVNSSRNFIGGNWTKCGVRLVQENAGVVGNTYDIHQQVSNNASPLISTGHAASDIILGDTLNGGAGTSLPQTTITGLLTTLASATGSAGLNLPQGTAPTSPNNGDVWTTSTGVYARVNGATVGPFGTGGGIGGSATVGYEPVMVTNTTTITTSPCDHGVTTANTMTCTDSAGAKFGTTVATTSDGVHPGASSYPGNTTLPSLPANTVSIVGPPSATLTAWSLQLPTAIPTTTDLFSCVVTGTNCVLTDAGIASANVVTLAGSQTLTNKSISLAQINSGLTSGGVVCATSTTAISMTAALTSNALVVGGGAGACPSIGNGDFTYATHTLTGGASGLVDFSAITSSSGFKVPIHSSNTAGAAGVVDYDSTAGSTHMFTGGADSISAGFASAPTTGQVVVTSGTAGVIAGSTTPNIGAATGTSLIASGVVDGKAIVNVTTGATLTFGTTGTACSSCYYDNEEATAGTAITGTLPTASAGLQYCIDNAYNGSAANTGTLEILTSAAGQYIIYTDGTLSASGGYVISGGAARDSACVRGVDSTHWMLYVYSGTWSKH